MKRFSKILVAVLALCLLVGVLALVISADTGVTGQFAVNGQGYNTWEDAVAAAGDTHTIYLNEDWTVGSKIVINADTKLNLNGKTVTSGIVASGNGVEDAESLPMFQVTSGAEFVLEGKGTVNDLTSVFVEAIGASTVTVNADGTNDGGIVINCKATGYKWGYYKVFRIHDRSVFNASGFITVNAEDQSRHVIDGRANAQAKTEGASEINISCAKIYAPMLTLSETSTKQTGTAKLISIDKDVTLTITDSELDVRYGTVIYANNASCTTLDVTDLNTSGVWNDGAAAGITLEKSDVTLIAKRSTFISGAKEAGGTTSPSIMYVNAYMDAEFDECIFYSENYGVTTGTSYDATKVNQHQLSFTDCHFLAAPADILYDWTKTNKCFFKSGVNYKLDGGTYQIQSKVEGAQWESGPNLIGEGPHKYLALSDGQWIGGYMDNMYSFFYLFTTGSQSGGDTFTQFNVTQAGWNTANITVDGVTYTLYRSYFSDADKLQAVIDAGNDTTSVIIVDGVRYGSVAAANAQIKENSIVELLASVTEPIAIKYAGVKVKTNGYDVYGFASDTYKPVNYEVLGLYTFTEASENEKIKITYTYGTETKYQTVVQGTVVPEMTEAFPYQIVDNTITFVNGWEVPALDYSNADQLENGVTATPILDSQILKFFANGKNFDTLEAAMAGANGETITIYEDEITISSTIVIDTDTKINLNGTTVTSAIAATGSGTEDNGSIPMFKVTSGAKFVLEGAGTVNNLKSVFVEAVGASTATVNADAAGDGIVINYTSVNYSWGYFKVFRIHDRSIFNVSGFITVNAQDMTRDVIDGKANAITKTVGAAEINISRAKIYVPKATPPENHAYSSSASRLILVDKDVTLNITDSELDVRSGYVIYADGSKNGYVDLDASAYKNGPTWLDGAAENVKFDPLTAVLTAKNSTFYSGGGGVSGSIMYVHAYLDAKFEDCIFYAEHRAIISSGSTGDGTALNQHQLLFTDCHFFNAPTATKVERFFMYGVNYKIVGGSYSFAQQIAQGSAAYLELANGQWVGGYMDNTLLSINFPINSVAGDYNEFTHFPDYENSLKTSTVSVIIDGAKHTFIWGRFSDADKYAALVADSKNVDSYVITVDGVGYASVEEANAQIKENSIVVLVKDVKEPIEINYNNVKFKANGKTYPGFVSAAYTTVDYSAARGAIYSTPADESEIVEITYDYDEKQGTQTAVIGTLLKAPSVFDEYKRILDKEAGKYTELTWTLTEGETVVKVTGNGTAYPVVTETDAVIVNWTDDKGKVLDTDYYFPGENTVLDEFDGEDVAVDHSAEYYGVGRVGWLGLEDATTGLATPGTYTITADIGKVAPDTFPGLKYNLSLYSNYVLNFYIPAGLENKGVSNLTISEYEDGSIFFNKFASGMLGGVEYDRYGYVVGIADTELKSYYIVYYVDETQITFEVKNIGTPYYAYQVMEEYKDKNDAKSELTKTLVVNMANYADKVLDVAEDDKSSLGAQFYTNILTNYGDQYLGYYNGLTDNRFASTGDGNDIYQSDVADLNWITKTGDAISYVESISFNFNTFEPTFIIKLSETAVNQGICKPGEDGMAGYYGMGLHIQTGFYASAYAQIWAEDPVGEKLDGTDDVWGASTSTDYNYYVSANNNGAYNESGNWLNSANMLQYFRNDLNIDVYYAAEDGVNPTLVGCVNYSLAAYINSMIDSKNAANYTAEIEAAKALYAFSYASAMYKAAN